MPGLHLHAEARRLLGAFNESQWNAQDADHNYSTVQVYVINAAWLAVLFVCSGILLLVGVASVIIESRIVAPNTLGYVSTTVRNSRYLHLPRPVPGTMSGSERARANGEVVVMMQDVRGGQDVGKIALGLKHDKAEKVRPGRLYR